MNKKGSKIENLKITAASIIEKDLFLDNKNCQEIFSFMRNLPPRFIFSVWSLYGNVTYR